MKKLITCLMAVILTIAILPNKSFASAKENPNVLAKEGPNVSAPESPAVSATEAPAAPVTAKSEENTTESAEAKALLGRLDEIKAMDKTKLNATDKKNLRKEVRSIKRELKDISGGVYISAGALIVVLILLILLT